MLHGRALVVCPAAKQCLAQRSTFHLTLRKPVVGLVDTVSVPQRRSVHAGQVLRYAKPLPSPILVAKGKTQLRTTPAALKAVRDKAKQRRGEPADGFPSTSPGSAKAAKQINSPIMPPPRTVLRPATTPISVSRPKRTLQLPPSALQEPPQAPGAVLPGGPPNFDYNLHLCKIDSPVVLYEAPPHGRLHLLSYLSSALSLWNVKLNWETYLTYADNQWLTTAGGLISFLYMAGAYHFAVAPTKLVRRITAVPNTSAAASPVVRGPMLQVDVEPVLFFGKGPTFMVPASKMTRDGPFEAKIRALLAAYGAEELKFMRAANAPPLSWGQRFFVAFRGTLLDGINMLSRKNFVYINLPDTGQWKVDMPGLQNLAWGRAMDEVLRLDASKKKFLRKIL